MGLTMRESFQRRAWDVVSTLELALESSVLGLAGIDRPAGGGREKEGKGRDSDDLIL